MLRATVAARLAVLEQLIILSADSIASQAAMVERERAAGMETGTSEATLAMLSILLDEQEDERDKLQAELATLPEDTN